jgi:hypothetical protein
LCFDISNTNTNTQLYQYKWIYQSILISIAYIFIATQYTQIFITIDIFQETLGMHAFSLVLIAFIRPYLFKLLNPKEQEADEIMDINYHGFTWFIIYIAILTFIHHLVYFRIEKGDFHAYHYTLLKTVLSTIFSLLSMVLYIFLTSSKSSTKYSS